LSSEQKQVILTVDAVIGGIFFIDFLRRFINAGNRRHYFFRQFGWLDLIAGIPAPGFRLARIVRIREALERIGDEGARSVIVRAASGRAAATLMTAILATLLVVQFGSMLVIGPESEAENSNIATAGDAIWWSYVTITTVGYGDKFPVTTQGRIVGFLMLSVGVTIFAVITGFLSNFFINPRKLREAEARQKEADRQEIADLRKSIDALRSDVARLTEEIQRR
jgi:voltage-gated potassium channel Kch